MVSVNSTNENKPTFWEKAAGVGAGYATYVEAKRYARKPYGKYIMKQIEKLPESESVEFSKAAKKALLNNNLDKKGVCIVDVTPDNVSTVTDSVIKLINKNAQKRRVGNKKSKQNIPTTKLEKKLDDMLKKIRKRNDEKLANAINIISEGKNACYIPSINKVLVNPNKMGFSTSTN